ncbi:MAG: hypothetical protein M1812_001698 [Candelaria pacifica]|nr:MAG: hypothetical protein M1812_001698 [Candelaria pacifica]
MASIAASVMYQQRVPKSTASTEASSKSRVRICGGKTSPQHFPFPNVFAALSSRKRPKKSRKSLPHLPATYRDDVGLPFQDRDLSTEEVSAIFGPNTDPAFANHILRVLHGRRIAGTLDNGIWYPEATGFSKHLVANAQAWLRANHPVDEEGAVRRREDAEYRQIEQQLVADSERLGIYAPQSGVKGGDVYGKSGLDAIREDYHEKIRKKEEAQENEGTTNTKALEYLGRKAELTERRPSKWLEYYRERAILTKDPVPPKIGKWQALWPSAIVTTIVIGLSVIFAQSYIPPGRSARLWPDMPPAAATVFGLILANAAILVAWRFPPAWRFLNKYFINVPGYPVALSMIGNVFSHQQIRHFATNMGVLWFIGTKLHDDIGRGDFLALYMSSGVIATLVSLSSFVLRGNLYTSTLGASGAIMGVIAAWCNYNSDRQFSIFFIPPEWVPPLSSNTILAFILLIEVLGIRRGWVAGVDRWAHLGGAMTGLVGSQLLKLRSKQRKSESNPVETGVVSNVVRIDR